MFMPDLAALTSLPPPPDYAWSFVDTPFDQLAPEARNAVGWTAAVGASMDATLARARMVPGFHHAAVGFLHETVDIGFNRAELPIGVILYARADLEASDALGDRLGDAVFEPIRPEGSELAFPVTVRPGQWRAGGGSRGGPATPPTLAGGRLACWVTTRAGLCKGWLTAAHAAPVLGTVVDAASDCTDAAVIAGQRPLSITAQAAFRYPAFGVTTHLDLAAGTAHATILDVSTDFDIYRSPRFPVRFSLSTAGQPGLRLVHLAVLDPRTARPLPR